MRRIYLTFFQILMCYMLSQAAPDSVLIKKIESIARDVSKQYVPDKRSAVFTLVRDSLGGFNVETTSKSAAESFLERIKGENLTFPLSIQLLPEASLNDRIFGLVNVSVGNIRSRPGNAEEMASQALLGWQLDILKKKGGYYLIRTPDGYIGWLDEAAVNLKNKADIVDWNGSKRLIFIEDYGHAYSEANKQSLRVSDLVLGNILKFKGEREGFYEVIFPDGREAFVAKELMQEFNNWKRNTVASAASVIKVAKRMIGVPYLWGGTSIKGVDCSGFTKTAYFMNGLIIPRDASQQVLVGQPVDILTNDKLDTTKALKNLQTGDLLFFAGGAHRKPSARVTHVALYLGNGQFIHSAGKVRINSMLSNDPNYDDFQSRTVVAARRYLNSIGSVGLERVN
jgi:gamma-D-glutamyl-L-lysine dipeptidyl-peptidase